MGEIPSLKKNLIYSMGFKAFSMITPLITAPYLARVLGADGIGVQSYTVSNQTYFSMIAVLGTAEYGIREIARVRQDVKERSKIFWEIELLSVFTSIAALILWLVFIVTVSEYKMLYCILSINILAKTFDISWFFYGFEKINVIVIRDSIFKILGILLVFAFVKKKEDLIVYFIIFSLSSFVSSISLWTLLKDYLVKISIKELDIFRHFKEVLIFFIPNIAASIYVVLDKTLIGVITHDAFENGYYQQADKIIGMIKSLVISAVNSVMGARIAFLFQQKEYDEIKLRIQNSVNFLFFSGAGICAVMSGIAESFVPIFFGSGYEKVVPLLIIMSPVVIIIGLARCMDTHYFTPSGQKARSNKYIIVGAIVNLFLNLLLIRRYGSVGAAIATIVAESVIAILYVSNATEYISWSIIFRDGFRKIVSAFMCYIAIRLMTRAINGIFGIIIASIFGSIIYGLLLILLNDKWTYRYFNKLKLIVSKEKK